MYLNLLKYTMKANTCHFQFSNDDRIESSREHFPMETNTTPGVYPFTPLRFTPYDDGEIYEPSTRLMEFPWSIIGRIHHIIVIGSLVRYRGSMGKNSGKGLNAQTDYRATTLFGSLAFVGPLPARILLGRFSKAHGYTTATGVSP